MSDDDFDLGDAVTEMGEAFCDVVEAVCELFFTTKRGFAVFMTLVAVTILIWYLLPK